MRPRGSVERLKSGRYRVRLPDEGRRVGTGETYATKAEARAVLDALLAALDAGPPPAVWTVGGWAAAWLDGREQRHEIRASSAVAMRVRVRHLQRDPIGSRPLAALTRPEVVAWTRRARMTFSPGTTKLLLSALSGALSAALEEGLVRANVARTNIQIPTPRGAEEPWTWLRPEELARLLDVTPEPHRWIVAFAAGTGLRAGEICALRRADVHDEGADPYVLVRYGTAPSGPTKGGRPRRVPLFGLGALAWREWRRCSPKPHELAFPSSLGGYRSGSKPVPWPAWKRAVKAAAFGRPVRWHDLRHTCASLLLSGAWGRTWSLDEIRQILGHASVAQTDRYAHLGPDAIARAGRETLGPSVHAQPTPRLLPPFSPAISHASENPSFQVLDNDSEHLAPVWTDRGPSFHAAELSAYRWAELAQLAELETGG